jgi:hypothetical protein
MLGIIKVLVGSWQYGWSASGPGCGEGEAIYVLEVKKPSEILNLSRQ